MEKRGSIQNKYLIKAYLKEKSYEVGIGLLIILFIFHSLSDFLFKKRVLKNKFRRAQKLN